MKVTNLEINFDTAEFMEELKADCETQKTEQAQSKKRGLTVTIAFILIYVIMFVIMCLKGVGGEDDFFQSLFEVFAVDTVIFTGLIVIYWLFLSVGDTVKFDWFNELSKTQRKEVLSYLEENEIKIDQTQKEWDKLPAIKDIPYIDYMVRNIYLMLSIVSGDCTVNIDWNNDRIIFLSHSGSVLCTRGIEDVVVDSDKRNLSSEDVFVVINSNTINVCEKKAISQHLKVGFTGKEDSKDVYVRIEVADNETT